MAFKPKTINFAFALHNHQPVGNFEGVFEESYRSAYLPFLEVLEGHPTIKMTLHYTGILFEWLKLHKPEFVLRLKQLVDRGQLELMTGGYYEPILPSIPDRDKLGQIRKLTKFVKDNTGYEASGMWLAERVWEPYLPKPLNEAGIKFVLIDDQHFKLVGMTEDELHGAYVTEEQDYPVMIFPIDMKLRYLIPFRMVHETIDYLRGLATEDGSRIAVMADDGEKFGSWPGTYGSVYGEKWLENFFIALEQNADWIRTTTYSEYLKKYPPIGRTYLPTASYSEMMEWALPTPSGIEFTNAMREVKNRGLEGLVGKFMRGGFWRFFLVKYPESNNMNKKMFLVSNKVWAMGKESREMAISKEGVKGGEEFERLVAKAKDELWQGQCNCPYWHGVFGGLYINYLRSAIYQHLIEAENIADAHKHMGKPFIDVSITDFDRDGIDEALISTDVLNAYFDVNYGGGLFELDFRTKNFNITNVLMRRQEPYHISMRESARGMKEADLERYLKYDWYRRYSLLDHFFNHDTVLDQFQDAQYPERGDFVNQAYALEKPNVEGGLVALRMYRNGGVWQASDFLPVRVEKLVKMQRGNGTIEVDYSVENAAWKRLDAEFGVEFNLTMLAGNAPDRYYFSTDANDQIHDRLLGSKGITSSTKNIGMRDEYVGMELSLSWEKPGTVWRFPIETVSQSESGFERAYQGSSVMPHWTIGIEPRDKWHQKIIIEVKSLK